MSPFTAANKGIGPMISESRKAIAAFLLAFLGPLGVLLLATDQDLSVRNVVASVVAGLIAGLGTYIVPNAPKAPPAPPLAEG